MSAPTETEALAAFRERCAAYLRHGFDRAGAARFVVRAAGGLAGPVLDVGTGKGLCAVELARSGFAVVSIDPDRDEQAVAALVAREAGVSRSIEFIRGDTVYLDFEDGHFGAATTVGALHHLERPGPVLRELARVVRRGGRVVVADFDEQGFDVVARVLRAEGREHERTGVTVDGAVEALEAAGFECLGRTNGFLHDVAVLSRR